MYFIFSVKQAQRQLRKVPNSIILTRGAALCTSNSMWYLSSLLTNPEHQKENDSVLSLSIYTVIYSHTNIVSVNVATITRLLWPYYLVNVEIRTQYLNLIDVHFLVCFLHVFEANFHGINLKKKNKCQQRATFSLVIIQAHFLSYRGFSVFKGLDSVVCLFHIE